MGHFRRLPTMTGWSDIPVFRGPRFSFHKGDTGRYLLPFGGVEWGLSHTGPFAGPWVVTATLLAGMSLSADKLPIPTNLCMLAMFG